MPLETTNVIAAVIGKKGSGKTTLMLSILLANAEKAGPFVVFNGGKVAGQFNALPSSERSNFLGLNPLHWQKALAKGKKYLCYDGSDASGFLSLCKELANVEPLCVVFDEIDRSGLFKSKASLDEGLADIVHTGRHTSLNGISLLAGFRRLQNVHNDLLSQADIIFILKVVKDGDIQVLARELGFKANGSELPSFQSLDPGAFYRYDDGEAYTGDNPLLLPFEVKDDR